MTIRDIIGLSAFFAGVVLHLFLFSTLLGRRRKRRLEILLLILVGSLLAWYSSNLLVLLFGHMDPAYVTEARKVAEAVAYASFVLVLPILLQAHWVYYKRSVSLIGVEAKIVPPLTFLLYLPVVAIPLAVWKIAQAPAGTGMAALDSFRIPVLFFLAVSYGGTAFLCMRLAARAEQAVEQRVFRTLFAIFSAMLVFDILVFATRSLPGYPVADWLVLAAWVSAILPSSVVIHYVYRYQFLHVSSARSLAMGLLILGVVVVYLFGVRALTGYLQRTVGAPRDVLDALFLGTVLLLFPPLSRWSEVRTNKMLSGEIRKYRELGELIHRAAPLPDPQLFGMFVEQRLEQEFGTSRVKVHLGEAPEGQEEPVYPLRAGEHTVGFLEIHQPQTDKRAEPEAMHFLANEIGVALDRCQALVAQRQLERDLAQRSHMEELGRMAATVAHNVKNPLSSMKTLLQLMKEARNLTEDQTREIEMMVREVDRLADTVSRLLSFSRLEGKRANASVTTVHLADFLLSLKNVFAGDLRERQIDFRILEESPDLTIEADADSLGEILTNLLSNAIECSPTGSTITVTVSASGDTHCQISIEDQGPGIPAAIMERIFEPFVTAKSRGTGLGLAIAKRRAEQLAGEISFTSPLQPSGTRFTLRIPRKPNVLNQTKAAE